MFTRTKSRLLSIALLSIAFVAHGDSPVGAKVNGIEVGKSSAAPAEQATTARSTCLNHCNAASTRCGSDVRRARQQCSRKAANGGRDPFTMRNDYTYFCGYFGDQGRCGSDSYSQGCRNRYARTYGLCVDRMQDNIASMRYDCYINERDAQNFCRDELRECKQVCGEE
jgi:hypothetical protein